MNAVAPLMIETPPDWDQYLLTDDDIARLITPGSIQSGAWDMLRGAHGAEGVSLPWAKTSDRVRLRHGEVTVWAGITHHGKTACWKQVALHLMRSGEKVCCASLEEVAEKTVADMARQALHGRIDAEWFDVAVGWMTGRLWLYNQQSLIDPQRMLAVMNYAVQKHGITHFVIDSLMRLGLASDDYDGQRVFLNRVTNYAKRLHVHVHLVCHMRKGRDEAGVPNLFDIRGAGAIAEQADNVMVLWRDKREDRQPHEPAALLVVEKQRGHPCWIGRVQLWWDERAHQFLGNYGDQPMQFMPGRIPYGMSPSAPVGKDAACAS